MKFIQILFSTPMVEAILDGRKTKTRRTKGLDFVNEFPDYYKWLDQYEQMDIPRPARKYDDRFYYAFTGKNDNSVLTVLHCPYGKVGDILWVRETWIEAPELCTWKKYSYKADYNSHLAELGKWKPSIHMPKSACRIFLKVKSVRVERLQDISEEDAKAEGVKYVIDPYMGYCGLDYIHGGYNLMTTPYKGFRSLWKKINGEQSWNDNPWVWVIEFERYTPTSQELDIFYKQN